MAQGKTHSYPGQGYGVEPCPRCDGPLLPGQPREVDEGDWRPRHAVCPTGCGMCGGPHQTGVCLL